MFWGFVLFIPGTFGGPDVVAIVAIVGVDVNYLGLSPFPGHDLLSIGGSLALDGLAVPLGVAVGGDFVGLPVAFAKSDPVIFTLQDVDELVLDITRCISPVRRSAAVVEEFLEKLLSCLASLFPTLIRDRSPILIFHEARQYRGLRLPLEAILTTPLSALSAAVVAVVIPVLDAWVFHLVKLGEGLPSVSDSRCGRRPSWIGRRRWGGRRSNHHGGVKIARSS